MSKLYGVFVDSKLVLVTAHKIKHARQSETWDKVRDAVWREFPCYDKPNCNPLYDCGEFYHLDKRVYTQELPQ